eukprot:614710-Prorocentrum_lima.AAC.1
MAAAREQLLTTDNHRVDGAALRAYLSSTEGDKAKAVVALRRRDAAAQWSEEGSVHTNKEWL